MRAQFAKLFLQKGLKSGCVLRGVGARVLTVDVRIRATLNFFCSSENWNFVSGYFVATNSTISNEKPLPFLAINGMEICPPREEAVRSDLLNVRCLEHHCSHEPAVLWMVCNTASEARS